MKDYLYTSLKEIPRYVVIYLASLSILITFSNALRRKVEEKHTITLVLYYFIIETISGVVLSVTTFLTAIGYGFNEILASGLAGFAAIQGNRLLILINNIIIYKMTGVNLFKKENNGHNNSNTSNK